MYLHKGDSQHGPNILVTDTIQNLHLNINPAKVKHAILFGPVRIMYLCMYVCMYVFVYL
jgi:hypothetical protein